MKHKALLLAAIGIIIGLACAPVYRQLLWAVSTCQVPSSALVRKVSVSAAEALHTHEGMPFGDIHEEWEALKARMMPFDELWEYNDMGFLNGSQGYIVLRFDTPVGCIVTLMG